MVLIGPNPLAAIEDGNPWKDVANSDSPKQTCSVISSKCCPKGGNYSFCWGLVSAALLVPNLLACDTSSPAVQVYELWAVQPVWCWFLHIKNWNAPIFHKKKKNRFEKRQIFKNMFCRHTLLFFFPNSLFIIRRLRFIFIYLTLWKVLNPRLLSGKV